MALGKHFVAEYPKVGCAACISSRHLEVSMVSCHIMQVSKAKIRVEATPWQRVTVDGRPHNHGAPCCELESTFASSLLQASNYHVL